MTSRESRDFPVQVFLKHKSKIAGRPIETNFKSSGTQHDLYMAVVTSLKMVKEVLPQ